MRRARGGLFRDSEGDLSESPVEAEDQIDHIDVENNDFSDEERPRKRSRTGEPQSQSVEENKDDGQSEQIVGPILYEPGEQLPDVIAHIGALLEVHVLADHLTLTNPQVKANRLWGHLKYTADSDVVAMLHHSGKFELKEQPPADIFGVRVFFRIGEGLPEYKGSTEYGLSSQSWHSHYKISLIVENIVPMTEPTPATLRLQHRRALKLSKSDGGSQVEAPAADQERQLLNAEETRKFQLVNMNLFPSTALMYNLSNDPCYAYELALVCDRGAEPEKWTSFKLKYAVLYLETVSERFELSCEGNTSSQFDTYRWAKVQSPFDLDRSSLEKMNVPVEAPRYAEVLHSGLDWNDISWDFSGVQIGGKSYKLVRLFWFPRTKPTLRPKPAPVAAAPKASSTTFAVSSSASASTLTTGVVRASARSKK